RERAGNRRARGTRSPGPPLPRRADARAGWVRRPRRARRRRASRRLHDRVRRVRRPRLRGARRRLPPQAVRRGALPDRARARETADPRGAAGGRRGAAGPLDRYRPTWAGPPPAYPRPPRRHRGPAPRGRDRLDRGRGQLRPDPRRRRGPPRARHAHRVRGTPRPCPLRAHPPLTHRQPGPRPDVAPVVPRRLARRPPRRNRAHAQPPLPRPTADRLALNGAADGEARARHVRGLSRSPPARPPPPNPPPAKQPTPHPPPVRLPPRSPAPPTPARSTPALPSTAQRRSPTAALP